jgi:starvation-inducible DNA-binding protein
MNTPNQLSKTFSTNFMLYWTAHVAHVNTVGRHFVGDHELLGEIYEDAQDNIDTLAEFMRILGLDMPTKLESVIATSEIDDSRRVLAADQYISQVYSAIETMIECYTSLYDACEQDRQLALSNYVQDRLLVHQKQCWKLRSILGDRK